MTAHRGRSNRTRDLPRVAVVNDYELVVAGVAAMLAPFEDRVALADTILIDEPLTGPPVDVALYDTFGRQGLEEAALQRLVAKDGVRRIAVYTADVASATIDASVRCGVRGYLSKAAPAEQLVGQIERVAEGEFVIEANGKSSGANRHARLWPGKDAGLSDRESEIVALVALGRRNAEIAEALFISVETVKTHLSRAFRKLGLTNRTQVAAFVLRDATFRRSGDDP